MRKYIYLLLLPILLVSCTKKDAAEQKQSPTTDTVSVMVMQIQKCSRLYTTEYKVHKIVTFADTMALSGQLFSKKFKINLPASKRKVAIPVTASVKAYIDFKDFSKKNVRKNGDKIEIILPDPQVTMTSTQVDHAHVKQKVSLLRSRFTDEEMTMVQRQGRDEILRSIPRLGIEENARLNAARQLVPIFEQLGYKPEDVVITFRKNFGWNNLSTLIKTVE